MELIYDSSNKYYHYLILHIDGLCEDLQRKNFNYILDNFIYENPKNLKLIMIKDGKNIFFPNDVEEDMKLFEDYALTNDDFIIIKNPSFIYECFNICYSIFETMKCFNKSVEIIRHFDVLKTIDNKRVFRLFTGKTIHLDVQNHNEIREASFGWEEYIIIKTGFTSKINKKNLEKYMERFKYLPNFVFLKDGDTLIKNEDIFTVDSPKRLQDEKVKEIMEDLKYFTEAKINDGFIVFTNEYCSLKILIQIFKMLVDLNYCSIKNLSDICQIIQFKIEDYKTFLYLRLDCEKILN
jgi:hypothetical protein